MQPINSEAEAMEGTRRYRSTDAGMWWVIGVTTTVGVALRALIPPEILWRSPHDDEGLMRMAQAILEGRWLGAWGDHDIAHLTMAKAPGYALFLAGIRGTGLTPPLATYLLYLVGVLLVALTIRRVLGSSWAGVLYAVLALNPAIFAPDFSRVYRDQLVTGLALLALGLLAHLITTLLGPPPWSKRRWFLVGAETLGLGLTLALLMITRSDYYWVLLTLALIAVAAVLARWRSLRLRDFVTTGVVAVLVLGLAAAGPATVRSLNDKHYQVPLLNDYSGGELARAVEIWASVETDATSPLALVDRSQREAAYAVSPTAAALGQWVDGDDTYWVRHACTFQTSLGDSCDDYIGYFTWALRDAAMHEGVDSPAALQDYFGGLADELEAACDSGALTCGSRALNPNIPSIDKIPMRSVVANFMAYVYSSVARPASVGRPQLAPPSEESVAQWSAVVNGVNTVADMAGSGLQPTTINQSSSAMLLRASYVWFLIPLTLLAAVRVFLPGTWRSLTGRVALAALAGWLANLAIVAVFYAAVNRNVITTVPIYIMASQSYLLTGLVLMAALTFRDARGWLQRLVGRQTEAP